MNEEKSHERRTKGKGIWKSQLIFTWSVSFPYKVQASVCVIVWKTWYKGNYYGPCFKFWQKQKRLYMWIISFEALLMFHAFIYMRYMVLVIIPVSREYQSLPWKRSRAHRRSVRITEFQDSFTWNLPFGIIHISMIHVMEILFITLIDKELYYNC